MFRADLSTAKPKGKAVRTHDSHSPHGQKTLPEHTPAILARKMKLTAERERSYASKGCFVLASLAQIIWRA